MTPRHLHLAAALSLCLLSTACATTPALGVRPEFKTRSIDSLTLSSAYATTPFGMAPDALDATLRDTETRAVAYLSSRGVDVVAPDALRAKLEAAGALERYTEGTPSSRPLDRAFERTPDGAEAIEVTTLRALSESLPSQPILFIELVYYSQASCLSRADEGSRDAVVRIREGAPDSFPRPCLVGHLQAKLVEHSTGATMWHNRVLLEDHVPAVDDPARAAHMDTLVATLLGGDRGVQTLVLKPDS